MRMHLQVLQERTSNSFNFTILPLIQTYDTVHLTNILNFHAFSRIMYILNLSGLTATYNDLPDVSKRQEKEKNTKFILHLLATGVVLNLSVETHRYLSRQKHY